MFDLWFPTRMSPNPSWSRTMDEQLNARVLPVALGLVLDVYFEDKGPAV